MTEPHRTEVKARNIGEYVVGSEKNRRVVIVTAVVHIELHETLIRYFREGLGRNHREVEHVLHIAVIDRHLHLIVKEVRSGDDKGIHPVIEVRDKEISGRVGESLSELGRPLIENDLGILYRNSPFAAHYSSLDSTGKFLGEKDCTREYRSN